MTNLAMLDVWKRIELNTIPEPNSGCWLWAGATTKAGYGLISVKNKRNYVHRLSYQINCHEIPENMCILHKCDTPSCCNPDHLSIGSIQDNNSDMVKKRRHCLGEKQGKSKLLAKDVLEIRKSNKPLIELAKTYNVSIAAVCQAKSGKRWGHLPSAV